MPFAIIRVVSDLVAAAYPTPLSPTGCMVTSQNYFIQACGHITALLFDVHDSWIYVFLPGVLLSFLYRAYCLSCSFTFQTWLTVCCEVVLTV